MNGAFIGVSLTITWIVFVHIIELILTSEVFDFPECILFKVPNNKWSLQLRVEENGMRLK